MEKSIGNHYLSQEVIAVVRNKEKESGEQWLLTNWMEGKFKKFKIMKNMPLWQNEDYLSICKN